MIRKVKNTVPWAYFINDLNGEEVVGRFYQKELQKTSQKQFKIEKVIKKNGNKLYANWKGYDNSFNQFPVSYKRSGGNVIVEFDLSNHAMKTDLKE